MAIMAKSDCNTCHNKDVKTVGPAYIDIAKRYPNDKQVTEQLVNKVITGGAGNWGEIPMTAHPNLAKEDAQTMVSYILALDAAGEKSEAASKLMPKPAYEVKFEQVEALQVDPAAEKPGMVLNFYQLAKPLPINSRLITIEMYCTVVFRSAMCLHIDEMIFWPLNETLLYLLLGSSIWTPTHVGVTGIGK
jgi:cytochrome c